MPVSDGFLAYALEQLDSLSELTSKRMFGGVGIYAESLFFGLIDDDRLYFKVDDGNRSDFEARDMGPFRPYNDERSMNYYEVPVDVLEDRDALHEWAKRALDVARRAKSGRKK